MARKAKAKPIAATEAVKRPSSDDVRRAIAEINRQKESASEYSAMAGQATKQFAERWNLSKKAIGLVRALAKMDDQKRQAVLIDFADLCWKMGFTDQESMFEDPGAALDSLANGGGPDPDDVAARTEADLAETPKFLKGKHADRVASEVDEAVGGLN